MIAQRPGILKHALLGLANIVSLVAIAPLGVALGVFVLLMWPYDAVLRRKVRKAY